jgi:adenylate kinase
MTKGDLVFMGPPGSGKGTQAQALVREHGMVQLSTGELFRDNIRRETALGKQAKVYLDRGDYVPDQLTVDMVRERLRTIPAGTRVVFDGFPRTVAQADELDQLLREFGRNVNGVIFIDAPRDELLRRLGKRAKEQGRTDDTPEVIARRLDVYKEQTEPVIDHYRRKGIVHPVDGLGPVDEVVKRLREVIGGA